jgi:uncharacterized protein with von Willebrand factor type A (vWA) domain
LKALTLVDLMDREQVYWAFRAVLVSRPHEIPAFDDCFRRFWRVGLPAEDGPVSPEALPSRGGPVMTRGRAVEGGVLGGTAPPIQVLRTGASPVEVHRRRDVSDFRGLPLSDVAQIAARLLRALPSRPGRRRRRHRRKGVPDLRAALRLSAAHGGDLIDLPRRRRVPRVPRLLVLLDASGSMDRHANLLLQLVYALGQRSGRVETFVFSTSLSRVTRPLRAPSFSEALLRVGAQVGHWSGGTRIGECVGTLNREYAHLLDRNTTVVLLSDGWETGEPARLAGELGRLRRRVRRLVWLNPLLGTPDYEPLTAGLQAARPYVDVFASALDLDHLKRLPGVLRS